MKHIRVPLIAILFVVLGLAPSAGQDQPKGETKYAPMPWHLVDHWWDIGQDTPFESLAVDVKHQSSELASHAFPFSVIRIFWFRL